MGSNYGQKSFGDIKVQAAFARL